MKRKPGITIQKIVVLRSDTVQHIIRLPKEFELYTEINGALVYINNMSAYKETYTFSGKGICAKRIY
ncbi:MAG: hypothetical protein IPH56_14705 [Chitinophagaceae bacterium]|nr:hypothetical protein [Chitinophagaceae bacterium]